MLPYVFVEHVAHNFTQLTKEICIGKNILRFYLTSKFCGFAGIFQSSVINKPNLLHPTIFHIELMCTTQIFYSVTRQTLQELINFSKKLNTVT